ncbi:MAG: TonB-dependent receptor, partial [Bacteroidales bacterium]
QLFKGSPITYRVINNQIALMAPETTGAGTRKQERRWNVMGIVTSSADNQPIPWVSVLVKGTSRGTITDIAGKYTIEVSELDSILVFSFIGMKTREVVIGGRSVINVEMEPAMEQLREVVVIGYGTESKALLTSSVGQVSGEQLENIPASGVDGAMQGKAAGVQITQNSGTPGAAITVRVRGVSSIGAGNEPLYVIDGIPVITGDFGQIGFSGQGINALSDINPADIESISILRDASAAAIYGARASNGVVLITTKRGKPQQTKFSFKGYFGMQEVPNRLEMLNASQFMEYINEQSINEGGLPVYSEEEIANPKVDTDWLDQVLRKAPISSYELSASGGSENTRYYLSGSIFDQTGTLLGTDYRKLSARVNIDHRVSRKLMIGSSFSTGYSVNNRKEGDQSLNSPLANAISLPPVFPVYNDDGTYNEDGPYANPVSIANQHINESYNYRNLGNVYAEYELAEGLKFNTKWGIDFLNLREHSYDPPTTRQGGKYKGLGLESSAEVMNVVSNNALNYIRSINDKHHFNAIAGYSFERYQRRSAFIRGQDFPNENLQYIASAATITAASASALNRGLNSFFGQVRYHYRYKYLFSFSARNDGSSKFGENNRYGFFPAASVAWRISEEQFFSKVKNINELKLRTSYGLTGNDGIPDFSSIGLFSGGGNYLGTSGIYPSQLPNPDLKWETTAQLNIGVDLEMISRRIRVSADVYHKYTRDLLLDMPIPGSSGFSYITRNIGEMENKGLELSLWSHNIKSAADWTTQFNFSMNRNKVTRLYNDQPIDNLGRGGNRIEVGEPIGIFYNWHSLGVDPSTGDIIFEDIDSDGQITTEDRKKIGNPHPKFIGGITNEVSWKNLSFSLFLQYSYGNDIFNGTRRYIEVMKGSDNMSIAILDRWQKPGDITDIPRATISDPNLNDRMSSRFIEDGSYLRIKDIRIGYDLDAGKWTGNKTMNIKIFIASQNLWTLTRYSGMDPEVNYAGQDNERMGTDFFTYPHARTFLFGINLDF